MKIKNCKIENSRSGQSLIEIVIALGIGTILIGAAVIAVVFMLRAGSVNQHLQTSSVLGETMLDRARSLSGADWYNIYNLTKGSSTQYYLVASSTNLAIVQGIEGMLEDERYENLTGYWKLDEEAGSRAEDSTVNNNDGTITSATRTTSCKMSRCLSFDGINDVVVSTSTAGISGTGSRTISAWIYPTSYSSTNTIQPVVGFGSCSSLKQSTLGTRNNGFFFWGYDGDVQGTVKSAGAWYHVVFTYDGSVGRLYVNGSENASSTISLNTTNSIVSLGGNASGCGGATAWFNGSIDDVRIYNKTFSADEVKALYNNAIFRRYFYIENVNRDSSGNIADSGSDDPSTQKITVVTEWPNGNTTTTQSISGYVTRWKNEIYEQGDWSGGSGEEGPFTGPSAKYSTSSNIDIYQRTIKIHGL